MPLKEEEETPRVSMHRAKAMLVNNRVVTDCKPRSKAQEKQKLLSL
jgi:hypothetical protein